MADENVENTEQKVPEAVEAPSPGRGSFLGKAKLLLFAGLVIVAECAIAYLLLPAAAETSAVSASGTAEVDLEELDDLEKPDPPANDCVEVQLGQYSFSSHQPRTGTTLRIDFELYGTIEAEEKEAFEEVLEAHKHRIHDQVMVTIRSSELEDLTDAGLGLIKRKILAKTTATFGKPLLKSVLFHNFSFIEQ
jgi:flagellar FliL protein